MLSISKQPAITPARMMPGKLAALRKETLVSEERLFLTWETFREAWTKWRKKEQERDNRKQGVAEPHRNCVLAEAAVRSSS